MILADVITAIAEDLATVQAGVVSKVGARNIATSEDPPPRIVWAPQTESFGAAMNISSNPRQLFSRMSRMLVHVWGADADGTGDLGPTETLLHNLVASIYRVCHGYATIGTGTWQTEDGRANSDGVLYVLEVTLAIPVTDSIVGSATVTSLEQTNVGVFPAGDETDSVIDTPPI